MSQEHFQKNSEGRGERQLGGNGQIYWRERLTCLPLLGLREPMKEFKEVILGSELTSNIDLRKQLFKEARI